MHQRKNNVPNRIRGSSRILLGPTSFCCVRSSSPRWRCTIHKFPDRGRAKSYARNAKAILTLKNNGRGEKSKIKQVLAKFGKKTFSPMTTISKAK
jgi:hypothetical protein